MREVGVDLVGAPAAQAACRGSAAPTGVTMGCGDVSICAVDGAESWTSRPHWSQSRNAPRIRDIVDEHVHRDRRTPRQSPVRPPRLRAPVAFSAPPSPWSSTRSACTTILDRYDNVRLAAHIIALANRAARRCLTARALRHPPSRPPDHFDGRDTGTACSPSSSAQRFSLTAVVIRCGSPAQHLWPGDIGLKLFENTAATAARLCTVGDPSPDLPRTLCVSIADTSFGASSAKRVHSAAQVAGTSHHDGPPAHVPRPAALSIWMYTC